MKQMKKVVLIMLCLTLVLGNCVGVFAKEKRQLVVTYKGKKTTIETTTRKSPKSYMKTKTIKPQKLKKVWGAYKTSKKYEGNYTWKAGKSFVSLYQPDKNGWVSVTISIKDKSMKLNGVSVGMSKAAALKQLKKSFGKKNVSATKKEIQAEYCGYMPITCKIKNGKVTAISFWHS